MPAWIGSALASNVLQLIYGELPKIILSLSKIPENTSIGSNKGFTDITRNLSNVNEVSTPIVI